MFGRHPEVCVSWSAVWQICLWSRKRVRAACWFLVDEINILTGCMVFWPRAYLCCLVNALLLPRLQNELWLGVRQQPFRLNFQYFSKIWVKLGSPVYSPRFVICQRMYILMKLIYGFQLRVSVKCVGLTSVFLWHRHQWRKLFFFPPVYWCLSSGNGKPYESGTFSQVRTAFFCFSFRNYRKSTGDARGNSVNLHFLCLLMLSFVCRYLVL